MPTPNCRSRCCCGCKICAWVLDETVYVKIQNLTFPTCPATNQCGCFDTAWVNDQTAVFRSRDHGVGDRDCFDWAAPLCSLPFGDGTCGGMSDRANRSHRYTNTSGGAFVSLIAEDDWGCVCVVPLPGGPTSANCEYESLVEFGCVLPTPPDTAAKIGVRWTIFPQINAPTTGPGCCWLYRPTDPESGLPGTGTVGGIDMLDPGDPMDLGGSWSTAGPVCDADGHFVSQLFTFTTREGITGEILVYV